MQRREGHRAKSVEPTKPLWFAASYFCMYRACTGDESCGAQTHHRLLPERRVQPLEIRVTRVLVRRLPPVALIVEDVSVFIQILFPPI